MLSGAKYCEQIRKDSSGVGVKFYFQKEGVFICGKPKEIRYLLKSYACRYRTVKELINKKLN